MNERLRRAEVYYGEADELLKSTAYVIPTAQDAALRFVVGAVGELLGYLREKAQADE